MRELLLVASLIMLLTITSLFAGTYSGGSGIETDPYLIATLDDLIELSNTSADWGAYFEQTADINATATSTMNPNGSGGYYGFSPIGINSTSYFYGIYDGVLHTISNLYINRPSQDYIGLFGVIIAGGCRNLGLVNVNITGASNTGGFLGYIYAPTSIITNCYSTGNVSGSYDVGGFIGLSGSINATNISISGCYSTCDVTGSNNSIGGFVGKNISTITNCYSTGSVSGYSLIGGFVGENNISGSMRGIIHYSYSTGEVSADYGSGMGGFAGANYGIRPPAEVKYSYWNNETSNQTSGVGNTSSSFLATGLTTAQMQIQSNFPDLDFTNVWAIDGVNNDGYPYLQWQTFVDFPSGAGTDVGGSTTINPSVDLNYAADQTIPPIPNPSFVADYEVVLSGTGIVDITINTGYMFGSIYQNGNWNTVGNSGGIIFFDDVDFDAKGDVPLVLGDEDAALPVTLSSFTGIYTNGSSLLQWTTQSESNNQGWNVYRSESENLTEGIQVNGEMIIGAGTTNEQTSYTYTDAFSAQTTIVVNYWLESVDYSGNSEFFGPISVTIEHQQDNPEAPEIPIVLGLHQNYPNPFNPSTQIRFAVEEAGMAEVTIFNLKGQKIATIFSGKVEANTYYETVWNGKNDKGKEVSSGVYMYQLNSTSKNETKRMMLIK